MKLPHPFCSPTRSFVMLLCGAIIASTSLRTSANLNAQSSSTASTTGPNTQATPHPSDEPPQWAIAIHGGAGSDPSTWTEEKRAARSQGLKVALETGKQILDDGGRSIDAVEAVIRTLEDNANFNAGRGAVVTSEGKAELDASIMDGQSRRCGAIAGVTTVKNPIGLARRVMTETSHVLLVGSGADAFAAQQKVELVPPEYFAHFQGFKTLPGKSQGSIATNDEPAAQSKANPDSTDWHHGTVGCVALDRQGHLAAGTSTGGTSQKLPGRVGDSPIVGAGTFADDQSCAVSGTGIGEEYIRNAVAYDVAAQLLYLGKSLDSAVTEIMTERLKPGDGGLITLSKDGHVVMQHNTPGMSCGAADSTGRFETFLELHDGGRSKAESTDDVATIEAAIQQQAADWNAGDLDGFMKVYWNSDQLTFSSGGQTTRGWNATLQRYRERYPDRAAMGKTSFSDLEFVRLDENVYQVMGRWELTRDTDPIGGRFTLIWQKQAGQWRIVHDHTSVRAE